MEQSHYQAVRSRHGLRAYCLLCGIGLLWFAAFRVPQPSTTQHLPPAIDGRIHEICRAFTHDQTPPEIVFVHREQSAVDPADHTWSVACIAGNREISLRMDETTGTPLLYSQTLRSLDEPGSFYGTLDTAARADTAGHRYLEMLGLEDGQHHWVSDAPPRARGNGWFLRFRYGNRRASLSVRSCDGYLSQLTQDLIKPRQEK